MLIFMMVLLKKIIPNRQLAEEIYKSIIRMIEKQKVYSSFQDNVCWSSRYASKK